jgi:putative ABC transport system permease protein
VLVALAALVLVSAFLAAALPRTLNQTADAALRRLVVDAPPQARALRAFSYGVLDRGQLESVRDELLDTFRPPLRGLVGEGTVAATTETPYTVLNARTGKPYKGVAGLAGATPTRFLGVRYQADAGERIRWVAGQPPGRGKTVRLRVPEDPDAFFIVPRVDVGIAVDAARLMGYRPGQVFTLQSSQGDFSGSPFRVRITGLYEPVDPRSTFWTGESRLLTASVEQTDTAILYRGFALTTDRGYGLLRVASKLAGLRYEWDFPVPPAAIDAAEVPSLRAAVDHAQGIVIQPGAAPASFLGARSTATVATGLDDILDSYTDQARTAFAVSSLVLVGLVAVALAVLALAAGLGVERRRVALELAAARGAGPLQVIGTQALQAALVAVPAGLVGWLLAVRAVPARPSSLSALGVTALALTAVAVPPLAAWRTAAAATAVGRRRDAPGRRSSSRRLAVEGLAVVLAIGGVLLLRRRGLATPAGQVDVFLAAVPILLALAVGLLALRAYPVPLGWLGRSAARRRTAVPFLGLARATREGMAATLPLLVLLLALALAVFASVVQSTVDTGQRRAAWQLAGADVRLDRYGFEPEEVARVERVPGVQSVVPAVVDRDAELRTPDEVTTVDVVAVDTDAWADLLDGSPVPLPAERPQPGVATGPLPALLGAGLADEAPQLDIVGMTVPLLPAGSAASVPAVEEDRPFVVVPLDALRETTGRRLRPTTLLLAAAPSAEPELRTLAGQLGSTQVISRYAAYDELHRSPLVAGTGTIFRLGVAAAAGYAVLAVLLTLLATTRARNRVLSQLRTLGLSSGQARRLVFFELAPLVGAAAAAGLAVGLIVPRLLRTAVDLRPFTGGPFPPAIRVDPLTTVALTAGLLLLVGLTLLVVTAANRRTSLGTVLRLGEDT